MTAERDLIDRLFVNEMDMVYVYKRALFGSASKRMVFLYVVVVHLMLSAFTITAKLIERCRHALANMPLLSSDRCVVPMRFTTCGNGSKVTTMDSPLPQLRTVHL